MSFELELSGAVIIRPLSREQIGAYLKEAGERLAGVRTVLRDDETLWELLETPLMLSIVALTYQGRSASEVRATGSLEQRRTKVGGGYIFTHRLLMEHFATLQPTPVSTEDLPVASPTHRSSAPG
jgi:hypothetical protein